MRNLRPESASTVVADSARRRSTMIKVGCALAAGVLIPAGVVSANASAAPTTVAHDGFGRNVVSGLGRADLGGAYTVFGSSAAKVSVASGSAHVKGLGRGQSFGAYLPSTSAQDSDSQISLRIPALSSSRVGLYVGLESRRQSNGAAYRAKVSVGLGGHLSVALSRVGAKGAETTLASAAVPFVMTANQTVNIETAVSGANPTKVAARVWRAGTAAPGWQLTSVDATAAQVRAAGHVGVWSYLSPSGAATEFFVSNYNAATVVAAAAPAPTPPAPTPPAPTPPAPTAPAPTPPAPAAVTAGAGSAAVGSTSYPIPAGAIFVSPSGSDSAAGSLAAPLRTVQAGINRAPAGGTIVLRAGSYHESVGVSKAGQTIQSYPHEAVWFEGSSLVSGWVKSGSVWVHNGWTNQFDHSASFSKGYNDPNFIQPAYPLAAYPDQVFIDGAHVNQVAAGSAVGAGQFAIDYARKTITLGSDPTNHQILSSDLTRAVLIAGPHITLRGLGVRRFGTPLPMMGTVAVFGGSDTVQNVTVVDNATQGLDFYKGGSVADHVTASRNGMVGIHGNEVDGLVIKNSVISGNNVENFRPAPSAAGIKITRTKGLLLAGNTLTGNAAHGIWLDESVRQFAIVSNTLIGNLKGIVTELSDTGIVANNVIDGGYFGYWSLDSGNILVFNNQFSHAIQRSVALMQDQRRQAAPGAVGRDPRMPVPDPTCPWLTRNIVVANNTIDSSGQYQVWALDVSTHIPASSMNLTVDGNVFASKATAASASMVGWGAADNHSLTTYQSPAALQTALNHGWTNLQAASVLTVALQSAWIAVPLPSALAADIAVAAGTQHVGIF